MGMTNAMLKQIIDENGPNIFAFFLDNEQKMLFGYNGKGALKITDVTLATIGSQDVFKVDRVSYSQSKPVHFTTIHLTESIQWVGYMNSDSADYRVDPLIFR